MSVEFGRAVWLRFYPPAFPPCPNPSFVAHLGGVAVGLTLGVVVLQNYEQRLQEQSLFWIFFCVYTLFVICGIFWNVFAYGLLDVKLPPPPWRVSVWTDRLTARQMSAQSSLSALEHQSLCAVMPLQCQVPHAYLNSDPSAAAPVLSAARAYPTPTATKQTDSEPSFSSAEGKRRAPSPKAFCTSQAKHEWCPVRLIHTVAQLLMWWIICVVKND